MNESLRAACDSVFQFPPTPPARRHGPSGYSDYQSYKPWLRDEFAFRCLYCLWRERWQPDGQHAFGVEHIEPQGSEPAQMLDYANLIYACNLCNSTRREMPLPINPATDPPGHHVRVLGDGTVQAISAFGAELIDLCRLNRPLLAASRRRLLSLIGILRELNSPEADEALRDSFALPSDLPNLAALRPPGGNVRPAGIAESFFEPKRRGELDDMNH